MDYMEAYTTAYMKTSPVGEFTVSVKKENNSSETDLHQAVYKVGPLEIECMVKENSNFMTYSVLSDFRHLNIVSVENFYFDKHGNGCIVLSSVDQTLRSWLLKVRDGRRKLKAFDSTYMSSKLSKVFRKMVIGMCDTVESMFKIGIYPRSIRLADIYLVNHASPTVKILISEVVEFWNESDRLSHEDLIWKQLRSVVEKCVKIGATSVIHPDTSRFFQCIGFASSKKLQFYPDTWTDQDKVGYLLHVMSGRKAYVGSKVRSIKGFHWPTDKSGQLPLLFHVLRDYQQRKTNSKYKINDPYDYLRLCRNVIKHWDSLPKHLKVNCSDVSSFLRYMEQWSPGIWCDLYEALEA